MHVMMDLVAAVNYLHKLPEPVCHRDIKSMNVLLKSNPYLAKLSDFGLAQRFQERETKASTCSSKFFGTPGYVDPEFGQTGRYTDKADVFGVGIVMMELPQKPDWTATRQPWLTLSIPAIVFTGTVAPLPVL